MGEGYLALSTLTVCMSALYQIATRPAARAASFWCPSSKGRTDARHTIAAQKAYGCAASTVEQQAKSPAASRLLSSHMLRSTLGPILAAHWSLSRSEKVTPARNTDIHSCSDNL